MSTLAQLDIINVIIDSHWGAQLDLAMFTCFACNRSSASTRCQSCNISLDPPPTVWYSPDSRHDMLKNYAMAAYFFCIPASFFAFTWMLSRDPGNQSQKLFSSSLQLGLVLAALIGSLISRYVGWKKSTPTSPSPPTA